MGAEINKPEWLNLSNDRPEINNESWEDKDILLKPLLIQKKKIGIKEMLKIRLF